MKTEVIKCRNCGTEASHILMGFMPLQMISSEEGNGWFNAVYCTSCESLRPRQTTLEELELAEERFLHGLVEHDMMKESEAREILGLN